MPEFGDGEDLRGGAKRNGQGRGQVKRRVERLRRGGWKESARAQGCVTWTFEAVRGRSVSDDPLPMLVSFRTRLSATFTTRPSPRLLPSVWLSGTIHHQAFRPSWAGLECSTALRVIQNQVYMLRYRRTQNVIWYGQFVIDIL